MLKQFLINSWKKWDQFWFADRSLLNLAIFRIILMTALGSLYLGRLFDVAQYYTDYGLVPKSLALQIYPEFYRPSFLIASWPDTWVFPLHLFLVIGAFILAAGIGGRLLNAVLWILHIAFLQRNYALAFGGDLIGGILLMLMIGTQSCARLSIANLFRKKNSHKKVSDIFSNLFYRLIQVQLAVIYVWTGFEKLKGVSWWDGTALWTVLANPQMVVVDMTWTKHIPLVVVGLSMLTVFFEIYFPFLIANKFTKNISLIFGVLFHLGIASLVAIWGFSFIMLSPYILFLEDEKLANRILGVLGDYSLKIRRFCISFDST